MRAAIGALLLLAALSVPPAAAAGKTLRVLFVGNSLTYYNDLPATFATVYQATVPGTTVEADMLAQGGARLRERLRDGRLAALLSRHHYDVVVLQDLGGFPDCPPDFPGCSDAPRALREAVSLVRAAGAQPLWFATWQRHPEAQRALSRHGSALARDVGVEMADVGAAMQRVPSPLRERLLQDDGGHPAPSGTWLAAAALTRSLAGALTEATPPRSCGLDWRGHLKATALASAQRRGNAACHAVDAAQWRVLRAAAHPEEPEEPPA